MAKYIRKEKLIIKKIEKKAMHLRALMLIPTCNCVDI